MGFWKRQNPKSSVNAFPRSEPGQTGGEPVRTGDEPVASTEAPLSRLHWIEPKWQVEMFVRWLLGEARVQGWQYQKDLDVAYGQFADQYRLSRHSWVTIGRELGRICERRTERDPDNPAKRVKMYSIKAIPASAAYREAMRDAGFDA